MFGREELRQWRERFGRTQAQMAEAMGMPLRSYQDIEFGKNPVRPIHVKAACWAAVTFAAERGGYDDLSAEVAEVVRLAATRRMKVGKVE